MEWRVPARSQQDDLAEGIYRILQDLNRLHQLDALLLDTDAGMSDFDLLMDGISDCLCCVLHLDRANYQGTATMIGVAREALDIPSVFLIANEVSDRYDFAQVKSQIEEVYHTPAHVLPIWEGVAGLEDILSLRFPDHPWSVGIRALAARLT
jgi:MinD-like ATPase involved in chromosome partitioning or flagellar assembly